MQFSKLILPEEDSYVTAIIHYVLCLDYDWLVHFPLFFLNISFTALLCYDGNGNEHDKVLVKGLCATARCFVKYLVPENSAI